MRYDTLMETTQRTDTPDTIQGRNVIAYTDRYPAGEGSRRMGIAICEWSDHDPFVVHNLIQDEEGDWFAEHGNYCRSIIEAVEHYTRRGGE